MRAGRCVPGDPVTWRSLSLLSVSQSLKLEPPAFERFPRIIIRINRSSSRTKFNYDTCTNRPHVSVATALLKKLYLKVIPPALPTPPFALFAASPLFKDLPHQIIRPFSYVLLPIDLLDAGSYDLFDAFVGDPIIIGELCAVYETRLHDHQQRRLVADL